MFQMVFSATEKEFVHAVHGNAFFEKNRIVITVSLLAKARDFFVQRGTVGIRADFQESRQISVVKKRILPKHVSCLAGRNVANDIGII